jgi:hypothetical protein
MLAGTNVQINIIHLQLLQRRINRARNVPHTIQDLRCDKQILSRYLTLLDRNSNLLFGAVGICPVDMEKPFVKGRLENIDEIVV